MRAGLARTLVGGTLLALGLATPRAQAPEPSPSTAADPVVIAATLDGIIHPVSAEFLVDTIARADREGAALVDLIASDLGDLLRQVDGRTVTRFDGSSTVIRVANVRVVAVEMTTRQRVLSAIAHPDIAYLLLSLGVLGLTIELWNPGAVLPGVVGGISLLLAFFAFSVLPTNDAGLLLILFAFVLFALEIEVTSYGLLTAGGLVSLIVGAMILIDSPVPEMRVSLGLIVPVALAMAGIAVLLARLAFVAQRRPSADRTGPAGAAVTHSGAP